MTPVTWPAAFLLAVLVGCTTALSWKGLVPVHVFFTVAGLILGYLIPKGVRPLSLRRESDDADGAGNVFTRDEIPTRKTLPDIAVAKEGAKEGVKEGVKKNE